ncbi:RES family NAD+ phosphorylase [Leekyejoonella antrihumi]|uniref:RES family NAD+ phosphorylase n=1 Tax=Leekyejoonella antrihumi TaxID=1660198 RepID=UPI001648A621|nr:RES family NAD+ phosphorylase [Leekyejoonella antrihumi]
MPELETPEPPAQPDFLLKTLAKGTTMHRCGYDGYPGNQAYTAPGVVGRFSPVAGHGGLIPVLYAATTVSGALSESVFHDVRGGGVVTGDRLRGRRMFTMTSTRVLKLVQLTVHGLERLGLTRAQMIDSPPITYPRTTRWAQTAHDTIPTCDGLQWVSRKDDLAQAFMLFGDRVSTADLSLTDAGSSLTAGDMLDNLLSIAADLKVYVDL